MNKGLILIIVGIVLVAAAIGGLFYVVSNAMKDVNVYTVKAHSNLTVPYQLEEGKNYLFTISTNKSSVHYEVYAPNGTEIDEGKVNKSSTSIWLNSTSGGKYKFEFKNNNSYTVEVTVVGMYEKSIFDFARNFMALLGICIIGIILIVVGIIIAIIKAIKK